RGLTTRASKRAGRKSRRRIGVKPTVVALLSFYDGPLVIDDLPSSVGPPPDGRPASHSRALKKRVRKQVIVTSDLEAMKIARLPDVFARVLVPFFQHVQHIRPAVAATGGADFPEVGLRHVLEIATCRSKLRTMKDGLATYELFQNVQMLR